MIEFPAIALLGVYLAALGSLAIAAAANLYHGYRYGRTDGMTMLVNSIFLTVVVGILAVTAVFLLPVDWTQNFSLTTPSSEIKLPATSFPSDVNDIPNLTQ